MIYPDKFPDTDLEAYPQRSSATSLQQRAGSYKAYPKHTPRAIIRTHPEPHPNPDTLFWVPHLPETPIYVRYMRVYMYVISLVMPFGWLGAPAKPSSSKRLMDDACSAPWNAWTLQLVCEHAKMAEELTAALGPHMGFNSLEVALPEPKRMKAKYLLCEAAT